MASRYSFSGPEFESKHKNWGYQARQISTQVSWEAHRPRGLLRKNPQKGPSRQWGVAKISQLTIYSLESHPPPLRISILWVHHETLRNLCILISSLMISLEDFGNTEVSKSFSWEKSRSEASCCLQMGPTEGWAGLKSLVSVIPVPVGRKREENVA